jgi:hypothetical protein
MKHYLLHQIGLWYIPAALHMSPAPCQSDRLSVSGWVSIEVVGILANLAGLEVGKEEAIDFIMVGSGFPNEVGRLPNTRPHPAVHMTKNDYSVTHTITISKHTHTHNVTVLPHQTKSAKGWIVTSGYAQHYYMLSL